MDPKACKSENSEPMEITDSDDEANAQPMDLSVKKKKKKKKSSGSPPPPKRPTVVVMQQSAAAAAAETLQDVRKPLLAVPPQIADRPVMAADTPPAHSPMWPQPLPFFFTGNNRGPFGSAASRSPPPPPEFQQPPIGLQQRADFQILQQCQLGDLDVALHQHQLQLQQHEQQLRFQYQLHQHQLRMAAYNDVGGHSALHLDAIMIARQMAAAIQPPLSASSTDSDPFPFGHMNSIYRPGLDDFGFGNNNNSLPYYSGLPGNGRGSEGQEYGDLLQLHRGSNIFGAATMQALGGGVGMAGMGREQPVVDPEDVADIYRTAEFQAFRQRYMDSLGPPRNYEKMRRSAPANRQPPSFDLTYAQKRIKNNEAAKKSRDAKRQKYLENQICVMYLSKKIREMKDLKRRLLTSMSP